MLHRRATLLLGLLGLLAVFGYGVVRLFNMRFAGGDVYPHYSSFRADPLGTRVYYQGLEQVGPARVRRLLQSVRHIPQGRGTTLFVFGLPWNEMSADPDEYGAIEAFVRDGGRLVVALYPELARPRFFTSGTGPSTNRPAFRNPLQDEESHVPRINLREKWQFGYEYIAARRDTRFYAPLTVQRIAPLPLPESVSWHSALVFTNLDPQWRVIYARGTDPVMIEREHGQGSIVVATDSYFVSNEAMRNERSPDLLAWLAGNSGEIVFNETHLGVQEQPGIATLARRYKLHGGVAALLALAALFIWKSSVSFVPRTEGSGPPDAEYGRASAAGFENLLRRSVPPKDILQAALDEWHKSSSLDPRVSPPRREKIRAVVDAFNSAEKPNLVETYRQIARILKRNS